MPGKNNRKGLLWQALYSCALGLAISLTLSLHYESIRSGPDRNYLVLSVPTLLKGIAFAVPVFLLVLLLSKVLQKISWGSLSQSFSSRRFFWIAWAVLVLSWLPWLLTFFPGGVVGDGAETLEYVVNDGPISGRWGVGQILVLRLFQSIGHLFSQDVNIGIFLYALCSCFLYAGACAAVVTELRKRGVPLLFVVLTIILYAFSGHYASYSISLWKDSLFGAGIVLLSLFLWREPEPGKVPKDWTAKTVLVLLFLCFWRNFIAYVVGVLGIALLLFSKQKRRLLAILMILVSLFSVVLQGPGYRLLGVERTSVAESLAIPLQQVAAALDAGAELTLPQAEVLNELLPVENWFYTPAISDGLKIALNDDAMQRLKFSFLWVWLQLLPSHPLTYLKAHLMEVLGFWQPFGGNKGFYFDWFVGVQDLYGRGYESRDLIHSLTGWTVAPSLKARLEYLPSGTVAWILLLSLTLILSQHRKKKHRLTVLLPFLVCWVTVLFSAPIAYSYRYVEMLAMGLPLFLFLPLLREEDGKQEQKEKKARILDSGKLSAAVAALAAAGLLVFTVLTAYAPGRFTDGKLIIHAAGGSADADYYITQGLNSPEGNFAWTEGKELKADFPTGETGELFVLLHVSRTFNGTQRYTVTDRDDTEIASGEISGPGKIGFRLTPKDGRISFTVHLPDAVRVREVDPSSEDNRELALCLTEIEILQDPEKGEARLNGPAELAPGESVSFTEETPAHLDYQPEGFSISEANYTWSEGAESSLTLIPVTDRASLSFTLQVAATIDQQRCEILAGDETVWEGTLAGSGTVSFTVPNRAPHSPLTIRFRFPDAREPGNGDTRILAVAFTRLTLENR